MALFQIGATAVFLDEWVGLERLRLCCKLADCKAFIAPWKFRWIGFFIPEIRKIPIKPRLRVDLSKQTEALADCGEDDTALITFTTGSTGTPKAARRTHAFLGHQFRVLAAKMASEPGTVVMTTLPIVLLINFGTGASSMVARFSPKKAHRLKAHVVLKEMAAYQVHTLIASPYFVQKLAESAADHLVPSLKKVFTGGGPVFPTEAALFKKAFPTSAIQVVYGSTEAEPIAGVSVEQLLEKSDLVERGGLCVGTQDLNIQLEIIEISDAIVTGNKLERLRLPQGYIGEIIVAGDHVLKSYYNNEAAFQRNKIIDHQGVIWHRTGDAGFVGADGLLYLCGRCNQMIFRNGRWISPFIWESVFAQSGLVVRGTVMDWDGQLIAVVQSKPDTAKVSEETLMTVIPEQVDRIIWLEKIPLDPRHHTKIDYEGLKKQMEVLK
jgi:acyl-CoA synthetase (AMP-forming)/AMP-acid ligase II